MKEGDEDEEPNESESSFSRRGSRSEGRINLSVQEVLSADMSGKLKLEKRRPEGKLELRTKLFDGISNVKLIGKNENEKFLGHAGMGIRKMPGHFQKKLAGAGEPSDNDGANLHCDNRVKKKKSSANSSTDDEDDEEKKKAFKPSFSLNNKYSKQRRDSHDDSSDSQEPATGTSNRILININKSGTAAKPSSNDGQDGKRTKSDGVNNDLAESREEEHVEECHDQVCGEYQPMKQDYETTTKSKSNKNNSNGKVKKNSSRFLGFLRETSETRDYNFKSNRKSFSDAEFLKIRNEKSDKELCPTENRKLVGRYLEVGIK